MNDEEYPFLVTFGESTTTSFPPTHGLDTCLPILSSGIKSKLHTQEIDGVRLATCNQIGTPSTLLPAVLFGVQVYFSQILIHNTIFPNKTTSVESAYSGGHRVCNSKFLWKCGLCRYSQREGKQYGKHVHLQTIDKYSVQVMAKRD